MFNTSRYYGLAALTLTATGLCAQTTARPVAAALADPAVRAPVVQIGAPVLGHFYDPDQRRIQPVIGVPGSGFFGPALSAGAGALTVAVSPMQDYALTATSDVALLSMIGLGEVPSEATLLTGSIPGIDRIALSPAGTFALVVSSASRRAQIFEGFPASPRLLRDLDLSGMSGRLSALAIDDAGASPLFAVTSDSTRVYAYRASSAPAVVYSANLISGMDFLRNTNDVLLADPAENRVIRVRDIAGSPSATVVAGMDSGVTGPLAVAGSTDGTRAFILNRDGTFLSVPLSGGPLSATSCSCVATQMQRVRGVDTFLLTSSTRSPLAVLNSSGDSAQVVFMSGDSPRTAVVGEEK